MKLTGFYSKIVFVYALVMLLSSHSILAQTPATTYTDTLRVTMDDAEKLFLQKNFFLLAQKFNVESQKALIIQARLFNNPNFYYENSIYNRLSTGRKYFPTRQGTLGDPTSQGEFIIQVNQLLSISGKRMKNAALAKTNAEINEFYFYDLLRNLRFQLRNNLISVYFLQQTLSVYDQEIKSIGETIKKYDVQYLKGNIALKEVERLKAFQLSLESEQRNITNQIAQQQNNLMILIAAKDFTYTVPIINKSVTDTIGVSKIILLGLIDSAKALRYDLKAAEKTVKYDKQFLSLQKATGVPDIQIGGVFDRNGSYIPNYYAASFATNLPFFNRNQGNIKFAEFKIKADQALFDGSKLQLEKDVWEAFTILLQADSQYKRFDPNFTSEYQKLMVGIVSNFEKRSISTLEFLDFYESFKNSVLQYNQLQSDRLNSLENLNFTIGKTLYKY